MNPSLAAKPVVNATLPFLKTLQNILYVQETVLSARS